MRPVFHDSARVVVPERLVLRAGRLARTALRVRWGLVRHPALGPVLIDTGYGPRVTGAAAGPARPAHPRSLLLRLYAAALRPRLDPRGHALAVLAREGIAPDDVRRIVVTHFHADHVAALRDFPRARIWASGREWAKVAGRTRPANIHHGVFPELLPGDLRARLDPIEERPASATPSGLGPAHDLAGDGSLLAVPLPGHSPHHFGVLLPLDPPLLYAVDVQWMREGVSEGRVPGGPSRIAHSDPAEMRRSVERVRRFAESGGRFVLCHEPGATEFDAPRVPQAPPRVQRRIPRSVTCGPLGRSDGVSRSVREPFRA